MIDENEFIKIYDEHADAIFRFCFFKISDRETAKDLTQEVFTKTWSYIADGKEIENIKAFLYQVARNLIIDTYRKRKNTESLDILHEEGFDIAGNEHEHLENESEVRLVIAYIKQLDEKYKDVIMLRYIEDVAVKDIATFLNMSENSISVRLKRGMDKLRAIIHHE